MAEIEMTDDEFLRYCEVHCESPRAGFVKENLDRLFILMGEEPNKHLRPGVIYPCDESIMLPWVKRARRWQKWMELLKAIEGNELDLEPALVEPVRAVREMLSVPA